MKKIERGEPLLKSIDYPVQTWSFGESLCMTFLAGEVCVDYAVRLKRELDRSRFWLNTYSNDFCSYIPSERLVKEGGYGGGSETPYFALPTTLAAGLEQRIVDEVHRQTPKAFLSKASGKTAVAPAAKANTQGVRGIAPKTPRDSLNCMTTHAELQIRLAAAEPAIQDPVAIDFGLDGSVYVAEMSDYGRGVYESFEPSGRVRQLHDSNGDQFYEEAATFMDGLRFPTDVKVWRDGLLICDAPNILFARDTDGDGKADRVETLFSGFEVRNAQARVNSLRWGLDQWLYGSCGLFGGEIKSHRTGQVVSLANTDFRLNPDSGAIEAVSGRSQQGRTRNDSGDWFGCSNGALLRHYPDNERYRRRNPYVALPATPSMTLSGAASLLLPPDKLVRFELSGTVGRATSACGVDILRDRRWGEEYYGDAVTCEPVHQLVHRIHLARREFSFHGSRPANEANSELLRSTDQWFRPVQARMGPDGALWIVDMYRFVIEHSRWIPQASLAELDVYAGRGRGRIYRVLPREFAENDETDNHTQKPTNNFAVRSLPPLALVQSLTSPNGVLRDMAHQQVAWRAAKDLDLSTVTTLAAQASDPATQLQALRLADQCGTLPTATLIRLLNNSTAETPPNLLCHLVAIAERQFGRGQDQAALLKAVCRLADHADLRVRRQVAWTLGETPPSAELLTGAAEVLAQRLSSAEANPHVRNAAISSVRAQNADRVWNAFQQLRRGHKPAATERLLLTSWIRWSTPEQLPTRVATAARLGKDSQHDRSADYHFWATLLDAADATIPPAGQSPAFDAATSQAITATYLQAQRRLADNARADEAPHTEALRLVGRRRGKATAALCPNESGWIDATETWLSAKFDGAVQQQVVSALAAHASRQANATLVKHLASLGDKAREQAVDALLAQDDGALQIIDALRTATAPKNLLNAARRNQLAQHGNARVRQAAQSLQLGASGAREKIVHQYWSSVPKPAAADGTRGRALFRKHCTACHQLEGEGKPAGPNLAALTSRDRQWLIAAILDPNRNVDGRYLSWTAATTDGRRLTGLIKEEAVASVTLLEANGKEHTLLRSDLEQFRSTGLSAMPEGLEKELSAVDMGDLLAYLSTVWSQAGAAAGNGLPRYPPQIAPYLLDDAVPTERRIQVIDQRPGMGPAIIRLLVERKLQAATNDATPFIPWIWRVALAVGKRNDGGEIRDLLELCLPADNAPLEHWQAIVIGGGVINGLTQVGQWPGRRIEEILSGEPHLQARWPRTLKLSSELADDKSVKPGTRYDALRMVALRDPKIALPHLQQYLEKDVDRQLQMGAVSGLGDIETPEATRLLIESLPQLEPRNHRLATEALSRTAQRKAAWDKARHENERAKSSPN